ncbi:MAG: response regulator [Caldilineaceae bacterium]|nr:response regulator [Caldilineaceae bacterium]
MTHILVVEDTIESSYVLESLLRGHGYTVDVTTNGRDALKIARARAPDLVISDILMPVMDGFTFCRQWMQDSMLRDIPFIFYSAIYTDAEDVKFGLELGARRFVLKPTEPEEFMNVVLEVLAEYESGTLPPARPVLKEEPLYLKVYNKRLISQLEQKMLQLEAANRRLHSLFEVSTRLSLIQSEEYLVKQALTVITNVMGYSSSHYFAFEADGKLLRFRTAVGDNNERFEATFASMSLQLDEARGLVGLVASQAEPMIINDVSTEPNWIVADPSIRSALLVPVIHDGNLYGVCTFVSNRIDAFSVEDLQNARILTNTLAIAIENGLLYQQQQETLTHLEDIVAARTEELAVALEQAQAADRMKSQFVSDINHELRTPLTSIGLYLHLLPRVSEERRGKIIATMKREAGLLQEMIEKLLDLSRFDLGQIPDAYSTFRLEEIVQQLLDDRGHLAVDKGLALTFTPSTPVPPVSGNQKLLYQALTNLLANALNYTESGQITLECAALEADGERWSTVSIADTGAGIAPEDQAHLFERFYRGGAARESGVPGTGLGLAICKEILTRHKGKITVESTPGQGSTFTIWLPQSVSAR